MSVFDVISGMPWAISEQGLEVILRVAARDNDELKAVATREGKRLDNTRRVEVRDGGVAVIPVTGPIFRHATLFSEISGATSIEGLATDFREAIDNPRVQSILLNIDSPGGEANGTHELAGIVAEARGRKPITAYVGGSGQSGAYWIASAADEIVAAPTALLGSIGVVASYRDTTGLENRTGVKTIKIISSQSPHKQPDPATDTGKSQIQTMVDDMASVFIEDIARLRGISAETVASDFGQGGTFVGAKAVAAGLADRTGTFEQVVAELSNPITRRPAGPVAPSKPAAAAAPPLSPGEAFVMSFKDTVAKWFASGMPDDFKAEGGEAPPAVPKPESLNLSDAPEVKALRDKIASLEASSELERSRRLQAEATAFADAEIHANRALSHERLALATDYLNAANDDHRLATAVPYVVASEKGFEKKEGSRVEALRARQASRQPHGFTKEWVGQSALPPGFQVLDSDPGAKSEGDAAYEAAKKRFSRQNGAAKN